MKKLISLTLVAVMLFSCLAGCKKNMPTSSYSSEEIYTSELGIVTMDGDELTNSQSDADNIGNNSSGNGSNSSLTTSAPITVDHGNKKGYFLNDLNNTGKKATLKNNCYSTGYPIADKTVTFNIMIKSYGENLNYEALKINNFIKEKMNVKINWIPVEANDLQDRFVLACSSGNMPDMFWGMVPLDYETRYKYAKQGLLIDLEKYINEYAPNIKRMFKNDPRSKFNSTAENGKMYWVPMINSERDPFVYEGLYINKTWLSKLNLNIPSNTNAFMKVLSAFKNNDPNGNGKTDEIPLCLLGWNMAGMLPACLYGPFGLTCYGGFAGYGIDDNGKVIANYTTKNYKTALLYYKTLYNKGLIDPDWTKNDSTTLKNKLNTATTTVGAFVAEDPTMYIDAKRLSEYILVPAFRDKSVSKASWSITGIESIWDEYTMISSKCKYPEIAIRLIDYFYSLEGTLTALQGPQGYNWNVKKDGTIYMTDDYYKEGVSGLTPGYPVPNYATEAYYELIDKTKSDLTPDTIKASALAKKDIRKTYLKVTPKNVMPHLTTFTTDKKQGEEIRDNLVLYVQTINVEFLTGKTDINTFWDSYVSVCKHLGSENAVKQGQRSYDRYLKSLK